MFEKIYSSMSNVTIILVSLSVMLLAGFLVTRLTKLCKLPNVTGYIIAGILIGPSLLGAVPQTLIGNMSFVSDIALAFIAFGVGKFFKLDVLKATGKSTVVITLFESMLPGILVFLMSFFIFGMDLGFSLVLGAISTATAPASRVAQSSATPSVIPSGRLRISATRFAHAAPLFTWKRRFASFTSSTRICDM